jgi:U4/U6.U5 tri-snRNP-associated protein 2
LQTVRRHLLDYDFEKVCGVSLTNVNVYGCLVCGRYFQGKGRNTHAFSHALETGHHLFINLASCAVFCLPDGYEVQDSSLEDVKYNLLPTYQLDNLQQLDNNVEARENLDGKVYVPGCVGLNNLKNTDYINVVVQLLIRVRQIR